MRTTGVRKSWETKRELRSPPDTDMTETVPVDAEDNEVASTG